LGLPGITAATRPPLHPRQTVTSEAACAAAASSGADHLQRRLAHAESCQGRLRAANAMLEALKSPVQRLFALIG
jgi:hypothetical protein